MFHKVNFVNTIVNYNYVGSTKTDITNGGAAIVSANTCIIGTTSGTIGQTDAVSFNYSPESNLFANYTTSDGNRIPMISNDGTVKLSGIYSIAYEKAKSTLEGYIIPAQDQLGVTRGTPPCVGASEYLYSTSITPNKQEKIKFQISPNPAKDVVSIIGDTEIQYVEIIDLSGKTVMTINNPTGMISLNNLTKGLYMIKATHQGGSVIQKLQVL
ncbi:hypothetical protein MASR2M117_25830 [Paludibacter sp.]